jgi:hypothetical protein
VYDFQSGASSQISQSFDSSGPGNGNLDSPDISPDGRFIAYRSFASNIVEGDNNGVPDVFLFDRVTGVTSLLSESRIINATADNRSLAPFFSRDGQTVYFQSWASDLAQHDFNQTEDVFAVTLFYAQISQPNTGSQGFSINWPTFPGKSYRVQFKNSLNNLSWQDVTGVITNLGSRAYFSDFDPPGIQRFYRMVEY